MGGGKGRMQKQSRRNRGTKWKLTQISLRGVLVDLGIGDDGVSEAGSDSACGMEGFGGRCREGGRDCTKATSAFCCDRLIWRSSMLSRLRVFESLSVGGRGGRVGVSSSV